VFVVDVVSVVCCSNAFEVNGTGSSSSISLSAPYPELSSVSVSVVVIDAMSADFDICFSSRGSFSLVSDFDFFVF